MFGEARLMTAREFFIERALATVSRQRSVVEALESGRIQCGNRILGDGTQLAIKTHRDIIDEHERLLMECGVCTVPVRDHRILPV